MQNDYIMRQVSQFAEVMAVILGLKESRRYRESREAIDAALNTLLGLDAAALLDLPTAELIRRLTLAETTLAGREKTLFVASLLQQAGDLCALQDARTTDARTTGACERGPDFHLKALHLILELRLLDDGPGQPNTRPQVEALRASLSEYILPPNVQAAFHLYYEAIGAFGKAEDALFELLARAPGDPGFMAQGVAFYERLLRKSDAALAAGNLPRDEVEAGLAEVRALQADAA